MAIAKRSTESLTGQELREHPKLGNYPNRFILTLFLLFCLNTVIPVVDVPLLGLSITSVFFALVALEVVIRLNYLKPRIHTRWILLAYTFWFGIFISIFANGLLGHLRIETGQFVIFIQVGYWLAVFLVTMAFISHLKISDIRTVIIVIGIAAILIGGIRLYEVVVFNRIGSSTARIFTQNAYGILFSIFIPFAIILPFMIRRTSIRVLLSLAVFALLLALAVNGSRSSWISSATGLMVVIALVSLAQRRNTFRFSAFLGAALLAGVLLLSVLPSEIIDPVLSRFETLERFEEDKSYATRTLMQQKSLLLFESNPLFGVGRGQFRNTEVTLEFADTPFSANPQTNFNRIASHNSYAQLLGETGLAGVIPYAALLITLLINGFCASVRLAKSGDIWAIAISASFVAMSIHMWSIDNLNTTGPWFVYGLVAGMIEYERRNRSDGTRV